MLFNSLAFVAFAPTFFLVYFLLRGRPRQLWLLVSSYFFYAWWDWRFTALLAFSTVVDFLLGRAMARSHDPGRRKLLVTASLITNLGLLGIFKYYDFFAETFRDLLASFGVDVSPVFLNVVLPVGISFYTFQTLSYTIDIYRRKIEDEKDFLRFANYVAMFPQLVAGPIVRASKLLPQLQSDAQVDYSRILIGLEMILWGFFLKLCLAENASQVVDPRFAFPELYGSGSLAVGTIAFALQIYGDFAGYSLIAIGLGRIMGFDFGINFNRPYFASSFSDFWRRWHISLSTWLRDYLYVSLGGNRGGTLLTFRNLMLTMLLGGLWHGAGLTFVVWGGLHGGYLVLQRIVSEPYRRVTTAMAVPGWLSGLIAILVVFLLTNIAWVYFRADSLSDANLILGTIFSFSDMSIGSGEERIPIARTCFIGLIVFLFDLLSRKQQVVDAYRGSALLRLCGALVCCWTILLFGGFDGASFIYFQF